MKLRSDEILEIVQRLKSILILPANNTQAIRPFHASLRDFLIDSSRSKALFINPAAIHFSLALDCITIIPRFLEGNTATSKSIAYACSSWCYHLNLALTHGGSDFVLEYGACLQLVNGTQLVRKLFKHWITNVTWSDRLQMWVELRSVLLRLKVSLVRSGMPIIQILL
jgi:hypothetical protein